MSLESLMYISRSEISPNDAQEEVDRIVRWSTTFNSNVGITGALIFTGEHFAQVIEGETSAISALIASIIRDPRHSHVDIVLRKPVAARQFPDWSMAYNGRSQFVSRHINEALKSTNPGAKEMLNELLGEFSRVR